jgi:alkylhydroperoxidase/carboxymuconolactone decarboxylase family protein YurZ
MSSAFQSFMSQTPLHAQGWLATARALGGHSTLDRRTETLAALAVQAALGRESSVPAHVARAKQAGATRSEIISALLVGMPEENHGDALSLSMAIAAFDGA